MVETSSPKPSSKVADNKSNSPPYKVKLVKGSKPLIHHKFYLDIEKHNVAIKIENKIKELGGSIEFILNKDITHFITDKQQSGGDLSESPATAGSKLKYYQGANNGNQSATGNSNTFSSNFTNPHTPRSLVDIPSVPSPVLTYETKTGNTTTKQISRTDAILLRVGQSQQQQLQQNTPSKPIRGLDFTANTSEPTQSPTQVVKSWGRPVWSTDHALRFFDKVYTALKLYLPTASQEQERNRRDTLGSGATNSGQRKLSAKVKTLRGDFIKIETLDKRYRPFYQEFKKWPKINLSARLTHSPFDSEGERGAESQKSKFKKFSKIDSRTTSKFKTVGTIMTRKSRPTQQHQGGTIENNTNTAASRLNNSRSGSDNKQCGYCEICHVEYDVLKVHLKSEEHLKFARNDDNFVSLDKLIDSGANVQKFLKLNETTSNKREPLLNGTMKKNNKRVAHLTNGDESSDDCDKNGINGSSEDVSDEDASPRAKRKCLNPRTKKVSQTTKTKPNEINMDSKVLATRIRGLRWNAPSPESRPPIKEPPVYKIAKDSPNQTNALNRATTKHLDTSKQVVVKLKRVRQSELNLLNNEAEQFMFPKTPTYTDSDTDEDRQTSEVGHRNTTIDLQSSDKDCKSKSSAAKGRNLKGQNSASTANKKNATPIGRRLVKRTEILLEDSDKSTEEPLGRLRFQEAPIQPHEVILHASDDRVGENHFFKSPGTTSTQSRWLNFKKKYQALEKVHKFNFERVPHNEPWYVTFERQDSGYEHVYEYFGNTSYCKLPYELGPLPPGKEDCCKLDELIQPKSKHGSPGRKRGGKCVYPRMPSIAKVHDRTRSSTAAIIEATKVAEAIDDTTNDSSKLKLALPLKKRKLLLEEVPRKSPREHASTLAILSSMSKDSSSAPSSISGANRCSKRERLTSQLSIEDDDNSNSTMTSQQTSKTVATDKDNSSVYSNSIANNQIRTNYVNIVKLCKQVDEMLDGANDGTEADLFKFDIDDIELCEQSSSHELLINSSIGDLSEILDVCSTEELTLKSLANKEKEVQRKITYTSKPKLVTSGFRFNKKRRNNRTGWPIRRKLSHHKGETNEPDKSENCRTPFDEILKSSLTPDIFAVSSDSLDTNVVEYLNKEEKEPGNATENDSSAEDEEEVEDVEAEEEEDEEEENEEEQVKPVMKSPVRPSRPNVYSRGAGKYQFEKFPKVNITPIIMTNIKTRSSDLQKRKSITPRKYTDSLSETARSPISSPQKYSPRKLRRPRGRWYRER